MGRSTIWKFPFVLTTGNKLVLPQNHRVLHVGVCPLGMLCLWAEVDPDSPKVLFDFKIVGTGQSLDGTQDMEHIGSAMQSEFIWHVYARSLTKK